MEKIDLKAKKVSTHNMRKVLPFYAKNKKLLSLLMIFLIFSGVVGIFIPIFSANALASLAVSKFDLAIKYAVIMCALGLVKIVVNAFQEYFYQKINLRTRYDLTDMVIRSINSTKMKKLDSSQMGFLTERMSSDVASVSDVYLDLIDVVFGIITNIVFLIYIAYLNIYIFLMLLGYVAILYIVCTIRSRIWIRGRKITKTAKDKARTSYYEQIAGIRDVKLLNIKENVTAFSNKKFDDALKIEMSVNNKRNLIRRIYSFISISFELIFLIVGIIFVKKEMIMLAGLLVIYTYYGRVEGLVGFMSSFKEYKTDGEIAATRIFELVEDYEKEEFGNEELDKFTGKIEMKNVKFGYEYGSLVLNDVSMVFEPRKMTAIVGKSGSGKTTILSLLSKLYEIDSGKILFDGKDISLLTENAIHSNIGEISQNPYIFNTSIKQNLLFVKPNATDDELVKVLKEAQIYNDIKKMKNGIDTEIGENGVKLSGGQKQRIAIARLLLMNSKVIVFDEATSALDNESQKKIVEMLDGYKKDKTIIIVAHRLSTIVGADEIFVLDAGKVIASGTHKWLMKNCEKYNELYKLEEMNSEQIE